MRDAGDVYGLRNNLQRVFVTLLDGRWHTAEELRRVGGSGGPARARELREARCGGQTVYCRRKGPSGSRASSYRLDLVSLTDEWKERILANDLSSRRKRQEKTCPACKGRGKVSLTFQYEPASDKPIDPTRWNAVFDEFVG